MSDKAKSWKEGLNEDKLAATVLYLLRGCTPVRPGLTSLLKMLWFADFEHYREHLHTITGARYVALPNGPVIENYPGIFEILEEKGLLRGEKVPVQGHEHPKVEYTAAVEPDEDLFTETELEILDRVIEECGRRSGAVLSQKTHREGPWSLVWDSVEPGRHIPYVAFRWLDNLPDEEDVERAKQVLARSDVAESLRALSRPGR